MSELAWYFTNGMKLRDGTPLEVGATYRYEGILQMCDAGYHFSRDPLDALWYAPGFTLSRVAVDEIGEEHEDKGVARIRLPLATHDVRDIVLLWMADVAEHAVRKHYTGNSRAPQHAIDTPRALLRGEATIEDCRAAAGAAADAVADAAAYAAARRLLRVRLSCLDWGEGADDE